MRTEVLDYLKSIKFATYAVSEELPFNNSGVQMYLKNAKRIYVDEDQYSVEEFMPVMNGYNVDAHVTTVRVFFSNDSKQLPKDYTQTVGYVRALKDLPEFREYFRRSVDILTEHDQDLMVTSFEFRFTKLIQ